MADLSEVVVDLLATDGDHQLPSLTREELYALGDQPVLADAADVRWWDGLSQHARDLVAETAQRGLIARNLITASDAVQGPPLVVDDSVQVILQARRMPSWLIVVGEPTDDKTLPPAQVALSGIDLREHDTSAVLMSTRIAGIYAHRLTRPRTALDAAAEWLLAVPDAPAGPVGRTVEVILPVDLGRSGVGDTRAIVLTAGDQARISVLDADGQPGEPEPTDQAMLREWLIAQVAGLASSIAS